MNDITIVATLVVALIGAVLFVAWVTRRQRAQVAQLREDQKDAKAATQARMLAAVQPAMRTAEGLNRADTKSRHQVEPRTASKLAAAPLRPSYRSPAPAAASTAEDWITPAVLAMATWRDDTPALASAPAFSSGGGGDYSGGGASGSWSDSSSSSCSSDSGSSSSDSGSSSSSSD